MRVLGEEENEKTKSPHEPHERSFYYEISDLKKLLAEGFEPEGEREEHYYLSEGIFYTNAEEQRCRLMTA